MLIDEERCRDMFAALNSFIIVKIGDFAVSFAIKYVQQKGEPKKTNNEK